MEQTQKNPEKQIKQYPSGRIDVLTTPKAELRSRAVATEKHEFKAEVSALLKLVTNSLYTNREIFLRELISNASDALDKARFEALVDSSLSGKDLEAQVILTADAKQGILSIEDTGIGMNRDEATQNLGTIAHSGTLRFLEQAAKDGKKADLNLIGQFGVGFYSAFMVADRVEVHSLSAKPGSEAIQWSSTGDGAYELQPSNKETRGTRIDIYLKEDAKEFLEPYRLRHLVTRYSNYVMYPIRLVEIDDKGEEKKDEEKKQLNAGTAIWARSANDLSEEDYKDFYTHVMGGFVLPNDEPTTRLHFSADAPIQFHALLYVPGRAPHDLFQENRKSLQLYARRVLIMEDCDKLLPQYLRFFRGVVDSEDLPLNVSREMLQENKALSAIRRQLTRKSLKLLADTASEKPEDYLKIWNNFGTVLKEGLHLDSGHRDELTELCRWKSLSREDGVISLAEYRKAMPDDQEFIYFIAGDDEKALRNSPHLEALRKKGYDVLLMTDAVDEWVLQSIDDYQEKKFRSVTQGELEGSGDEEEKKDEKVESPIDPLLEKSKEILGDRVKDVRASKRLTESASCLVDDAQGLSRNMERILRMTRQNAGDLPTSMSSRILELNPDHAICQAANALAKEKADDPRLGEWVEMMFDLASLAEGEVPDPAGTVKRIQKVLGETIKV